MATKRTVQQTDVVGDFPKAAAPEPLPMPVAMSPSWSCPHDSIQKQGNGKWRCSDCGRWL